MRPWLEIFIVFYLASIIGWVLHDLDEWDEEKMKMPRPGLWSYTFWGVVLVNVFWMLLPVFYLICWIMVKMFESEVEQKEKK